MAVAAWDPELERLRALAGDAAVAEAVGIGLVDAAVGTARAIARRRPAAVVLIGTCGAFVGSGLAIGDVVVASSVRLADPAVVEGRAAMPFGEEALRLDEALVAAATAAGAAVARVVNPLGITTDDALAVTLGALGDVEHLEAYAVARACEGAGVPCAVVLGMANDVGARGRDQWREHHVAASARAADVAYAALFRTSTRWP